MIEILAQRQRPKALAAIDNYLKHENDAVRAAAKSTLGDSGTKKYQ